VVLVPDGAFSHLEFEGEGLPEDVCDEGVFGAF
jgi:hypothetical protein